ncbi:cation:proton antiporter [Demequina activiva]|uniref:Sodium/hydrogen antiporter n=1 Tax=Demequina activiva TaxID=1582364 RepID=A0A919Q3A2_9MICO|nr:sodium:proton antiporter [Demequina activiva]GIG55036.1 sodium/hydrogen antiporter [Demequina activiva]
MTLATTLVVILGAGLAAQLIAARARIPAIVVLIATGLVLGPLTGIVSVPANSEEISALIGLGVAVVLFEGAMDLRLSEVRGMRIGIRRLTVAGPPVAMTLGALAAHYVGGLEWPVAWVLGALLVVTGPTVIIPLLRQARLNKESASLLKWEGIINDPIGVLLALMTLQYFLIADADVDPDLESIAQALGVASVVVTLVGAVIAAVLLGGAAGVGLGIVFRRGWIPAHLKSPLLLVAVLVVYSISDSIVHESGLLAVTLMGIVLGNVRLADRERLLDFKEGLSVVILSALFIIIPAQLELGQLRLVDWRIGLFVLALMFVVRPLTIALVTIKSPIRWQDRVLLGWISPRGIVAAATAGVFGPELIDAGYEDGDVFLPTVFLVIIVTVLAHGFSIGWVARRLGLASGASNGLLIVGASPWSRSVANALRSLKVPVLVADGSYQRLQPLRMDGVPVYFGEILSEHAEHALDTSELSYVLCASDNDYYNALVARSQGAEVGFHRTFMIATHGESVNEDRRLAFERRGSFAFDGEWDYFELNERVEHGWSIHTTRITPGFGWEAWQERQRERGVEWMLVGEVTAEGTFRLYSHEQTFTPETGSTLVYFAPDHSKRERAQERADAAQSADSAPSAPGT